MNSHQGGERRHGYDPDYTGPERRNHARRIQAVERELAAHAIKMDDIEAKMQRAVTAGLREILMDEELMDSLLERLRSRMVRGAAEYSGRWLLGAIQTFFSKWVFIGVALVLVANYIGVGQAKALAEWLAGGSK